MATPNFSPISETNTSAVSNALVPDSTKAGLQITSITYTGAYTVDDTGTVTAASSTFKSVNFGSYEGKAFSLGSGVLLTSGNGSPPLENTESGYYQINDTSGDAKLDEYASAAFAGAYTTNDAAILTVYFTVTALEDGTFPSKISLDFMFGSDEYPEYVDDFVDIAAIEVDGKNYAYFNQDPSQPLSVIQNNLDLGNFIDNQENALNIEYDGISKPLRITASLDTTLSSHVLRIAIADTNDASVDSGVFVSSLKVSSYSQLPDDIYEEGEVIIIPGDNGDGYYGTDTGETISGGDGDDTIEGGEGNDTITGGLGDDNLDGGVGNDSISGGAGADTIASGVGNDLIDAGDGNDSVVAGTGNDNVSGGAGSDSIDAGTGNDKVYGGTGSDTLNGGVGSDVMEGGSGADTYYIDHAKDKIKEVKNDVIEDTSAPAQEVDLSSTIDSVIASVKYTLVNYVENLTLTGSAALAGTGNKEANTLTGNTGNNKLTGLAGNDALAGGEGNDTLTGDVGDDTLDGGAGNDKLTGGAGVDSLSGAEGNDTLDGGAGNDKLEGGADIDKLLGGAGNDTLDGGTGADSLTGGAGIDVFIMSLGTTDADADLLTDFTETDILKFDTSVFTALAGATEINLAIDKEIEELDADDYLIYDSKTGFLSYDADGSGDAYAAIKIVALKGAGAKASAFDITDLDIL